jgi:hypothetical protein
MPRLPVNISTNLQTMAFSNKNEPSRELFQIKYKMPVNLEF